MKKRQNVVLPNVKNVRGISPDGVVLTRSDISNIEEERQERRDRLESIYNGRTR